MTKNWKSRQIPNDNPTYSVADLPAEFVDSIRKMQIDANKGWAPDADDLHDCRVVHCPTCKAPGLNTCWGVWQFTCGAEVHSDGEVSEPCEAA